MVEMFGGGGAEESRGEGGAVDGDGVDLGGNGAVAKAFED